MTRNQFFSAMALFIGFAGAPAIVAAAGADAAKQVSTTRVISYTDVKQQLAQPGAVTILDLRRNSDYDKDTLTMPSAKRFDPDKIAEGSGSLPKDKEIVLFCAHGRSISNAAVDHLTKAGYKARLVPGGFDAWKDAGGMTVAKPR